MSKPLTVEMPVPGSVEVDGMMVVADGDGSVTKINAGQESSQVEMNFRIPEPV